MKAPIQSRRNQGGYNLIELGLVLVLIALVAILVYAKFTKTNNSRIAQNEADRVAQLVSNTRARYAQATDFSGLNATVLINSGAAPSEMITGGSLQSGWNSNISVAPDTLSASNDAFTLTYSVPKDYCAEFVQGAAGAVAKVTVSGTVVKDSINGVPFKVAETGAGCSGAVTTVKLTSGR